ncbi:MAG: GlsB/YeaQ/YmgE family stress response membrane protein [Verrucomicrobiota bacterium]
MDIIVWIVLGLIAGALGKLIMPGKDPGGWIVTILLGIAGAFVGGFVGRLVPFLPSTEGGLSFSSIITATIGAVILLLLYRLFVKMKSK